MVGWTRFVTPPVFGIALSPIMQRIIPQDRSKVKDQSAKLWYRLPSFAEATEDRSAMWFLVDKSGVGGLDDWEVKIADFVVLLAKDAKTVP